MNGLIIDCFAGGGGASKGIEMALGCPIDIAINHDPEAIRIHKVNHPHTLHLTEDIFTVDLQKHVAGRHVALMWASPDCTSHSKAKGGQPRNRGLRILPWAVYKHAQLILPDVIIMENVEEIQQWGPLDDAGRPIKERMGEDYNKFIDAMRSLGYAFESRELVAADYGAPTTRKRWYAIFRRDGLPIRWPTATHSKDGSAETERWLQCGDYIDWSDLGHSIFTRNKPLADATMRRIANGYRKYVIENPNPYVVKNKDAVAFLIQYHAETLAGDARGQTLTEPIKTIDTSNRYGLVTAFITKFYKTGIGQGCDEPLHTITTSPGHFGLISAFLIKYYGTGCGQTLDEPLATITTKDRFGLVNIVTEIDGEKYVLKDIFLRMLKAEPELKVMQGFPADYIITHDIDGNPYSTKEQVARIGNSVVPIMAQKLVAENCAGMTLCCPCGLREHMEHEDCKRISCEKCCPLSDECDPYEVDPVVMEAKRNTMQTIDRFYGKYAFLSNFYDSLVSYKGTTYRNSEAAYQAQKAANPALRTQFKDLPAAQAKHLGRAVELRSDWASMRFGVMREIVHNKFKQSLALALLLADTGTAELIEGNWWHDNTFGDCRCPKCTKIPGQNVLGSILMDERLYWQKELGWPVKEER